VLETPGFVVSLDRASQTVAALRPRSADDFDFSPGDRRNERLGDGFYHLGDLTLRLRQGDAVGWTSYSTAAHRAPVESLPAEGAVLAAADLAGTLPGEIPLRIRRYWELVGDELALTFELHNPGKGPVEVGSLGIPMIFNNILHRRSLDDAHRSCVFSDPYIGLDAGYLQVTRLHGHGPVLLVVPHGDTPFEAYNPLLDDPTRKRVTFEGFYEWMAHSKAHAETAWSRATPWTPPTSALLEAGESRRYGVRFLLAPSIREIEPTLAGHLRPTSVSVPGHVLPMDVQGSLFLQYPQEVRSLDIEPAGALRLEEGEPAANGWKRYRIHGQRWGRARLTVTYADGLRQSIHYKVIKPEAEVVADHGRFLTTEQWFDDPDDPFGRGPSIISYDYEERRPVLEESRVWIAGLSDEGGAGAWLSTIMKQSLQPDEEELALVKRFVHETLWGGIQYSEGPLQYGVRKSLFYYEPTTKPDGTYATSINYRRWSAWPSSEASSTSRSYNYPHVAAAYWVLYRLARNHEGLVTQKPWNWYLELAYHTSMAMVRQAPRYARYGQMEGSVFLYILEDLHREGLSELAQDLEGAMKERADLWRSQAYPYGSEMPWDSTGQEEVFLWSRYFGHGDMADTTIHAILAYMPTLPHWGYDGSARRYWDFQFAGKTSRIERQLHHYGSGLNAIPVLQAFRDSPDDFYLLRVGYAGLLGSIANITEEGFGPCAFHAFPDTLEIDAYSGDYGPGFYGYAVNTATYLVHHDEFGWLAYGGHAEVKEGRVHVTPTHASRSRLFLAPIGLWITLDAGQIQEAVFDPATGALQVRLDPATDVTPQAVLRLEHSGRTDATDRYAPVEPGRLERGAYILPLKGEATVIEMIPPPNHARSNT